MHKGKKYAAAMERFDRECQAAPYGPEASGLAKGALGIAAIYTRSNAEEARRALVVLVNADGQVENRILDIPPGLPPSALEPAGNYLNARLSGRRAEANCLIRKGEELEPTRGIEPRTC